MDAFGYYWNPIGGLDGTGGWEKMQGTAGAGHAVDPATSQYTLVVNFTGVNQKRQSIILPDNGMLYTVCTAVCVATGLVSDPGAWSASTAYAMGTFRRPVAANGFNYEVTR